MNFFDGRLLHQGMRALVFLMVSFFGLGLIFLVGFGKYEGHVLSESTELRIDSDQYVVGGQYTIEDEEDDEESKEDAGKIGISSGFPQQDPVEGNIIFQARKTEEGFRIDGTRGIRINTEQSKSVNGKQSTHEPEEDIRENAVKKAYEEIVREGKLESIPEVKEAGVIAADPKFEQDDFDQDGLTNNEEKIRGTDPYLSDSDRDGFPDGDEIRTGYDPTKFSPGDDRDKIAFEDPRKVIEEEKTNYEKKRTADERYKVEKVELVPAINPSEKDKVRLSGKALPNIYLTLYVYSTPMVITVKTDADGNWSYDLDADIEDGDHEVYVAVTDNTGKITARSEGLPFVKTAQAVTVKPSVASLERTENQSPLERSRLEYFFIAFIAVFFFFGAALIIISRRGSNVQS